MYVIAIESSKSRGMGHFFRSLLYAEHLKSIHEQFVILINWDERPVRILKEKNIPFRIVDYADESDWQTPIIEEYGADVWLQDKFETTAQMAWNIKNNSILLCVVDEFGPGAELCDLHFAGMIYLTGHTVKGRKIFKGAEYVILNPEIDKYRKLRTSISNVIVSLGGSDPYGMTVEVVKELSKTNLSVEVVIGPDFDYRKELEEANIRNYPVLQNIPSLIAEFSKFDFAITGGGVTCCEANSCGIPVVIIANAPHEIHTGAFMQSKGGAIYAGSYEGWNREVISRISNLERTQIEQMSKAGMVNFDTKAVERIFTVIKSEISNKETKE